MVHMNVTIQQIDMSRLENYTVVFEKVQIEAFATPNHWKVLHVFQLRDMHSQT